MTSGEGNLSEDLSSITQQRRLRSGGGRIQEVMEGDNVVLELLELVVEG